MCFNKGGVLLGRLKQGNQGGENVMLTQWSNKFLIEGILPNVGVYMSACVWVFMCVVWCMHATWHEWTLIRHDPYSECVFKSAPVWQHDQQRWQQQRLKNGRLDLRKSHMPKKVWRALCILCHHSAYEDIKNIKIQYGIFFFFLAIMSESSSLKSWLKSFPLWLRC